MEEIKYFFSLETFMFNRLWSPLYYGEEYADGGLISRIDGGIIQRPVGG